MGCQPLLPRRRRVGPPAPTGPRTPRCEAGEYSHVRAWTEAVRFRLLRVLFVRLFTEFGTSTYASPDAFSYCSSQYYDEHHSVGKGSPMSSVSARSSEGTCFGCGSGFDGEKADVWALGVTLFVTVIGVFPWELASPSDGRYAAWAASYKPSSSSSRYPAAEPLSALWARIFRRTKTQRGTPLTLEFAELMRGMLHPDPLKRLSVADVRAHSFFAQRE